MNIKKLEQLCIEDRYSVLDKKNKIKRELNSMNEARIKKLNKGVNELNKYQNANYDNDIKNKRIENFNQTLMISQKEFVMNLFEIIMSSQVEQTIQCVVSKLIRVMPMNDVWEAIETASEIIVVVSKCDFYDVTCNQSGNVKVIPNYKLSNKLLLKLNEMQFLPPMICEPNILRNNTDSQYLGFKQSVILGKNNHHEFPLALDAINIASKVALSIDEKMFLLEDDKFVILKNKNNRSVNKKGRALSKIEIKNINNLKVRSLKIINDIIDQGNKFYFAWKFDKRGRMYSLGYEINIQSYEYKKSLISLNKKHLISK